MKTEQKPEMTLQELLRKWAPIRNVTRADFETDLRSVIRGETSEQRDALLSMINQFAYRGTKDGVNVIHTGGLSALEDAFSAIGLSDPCSEKEFELAITNTSER
jgi:hypothetical protein